MEKGDRCAYEVLQAVKSEAGRGYEALMKLKLQTLCRWKVGGDV